MLISSTPQTVPVTSVTQTAQAVTLSGQTTSSSAPAVINDVKQTGGGLSTFLTVDFIQNSVKSLNQSIAGYNNSDLSMIKGITPQQVQAALIPNAKLFQAAEQGIVAMASYMGKTGANLTFTHINGQAPQGTEPLPKQTIRSRTLRSSLTVN